MTKQQLKQLVSEVINEANLKWYNVSLDRPGAGWSETVQAANLQQAIKIANAKHSWEPPADTYYETTPPSPTPTSPTIAATPEQKQFAADIVNKIKDRQRKKGFNDINIAEAIRQMIESKLAKEGWNKKQ